MSDDYEWTQFSAANPNTDAEVTPDVERVARAISEVMLGAETLTRAGQDGLETVWRDFIELAQVAIAAKEAESIEEVFQFNSSPPSVE